MGAAPWQFMSFILVVALVTVIVYFLMFHKNEAILTKTTLEDGQKINLSVGTFTETVTIKKVDDTYTLSTMDGELFNFNLTPPPVFYEILTLAEDKFYIKAGDQYVSYDDVFSIVPYRDVFKDNESLAKATFTMSLATPDPAYDSLIMGPIGMSRSGGVMKTMTGDVNACKKECYSNVDCVGFNATGTSCELKTLNFDRMIGTAPLGPYVTDDVDQYWYKDNTYGNSNTYVGNPNYMSLALGDWNKGQTFQTCMSELRSPSHAAVKQFGMAYDASGKKCLFAAPGTTELPDPIEFTADANRLAMCVDPAKDINQGCK